MIRPIEHITSFDQFISMYPFYTELEEDHRHKLHAAWNDVIALRVQNETAIPHDTEHALRMAYILGSLKMDADTIVCALLYSEDDSFVLPAEDIAARFGKNVAAIVTAAGKFSDVKLYNKSKDPATTICKMFLSVVDDIRVMLVLLADRLDKIRYLKDYPQERQRPIALEISEIWAPLAQRLGISTVQNELEDLSLKHINREAFDQIKEVVAAKKKEREAFLKDAEQKIHAVMAEQGIEVSVQSRAKHFWSIYQKMKKRHKAADELYDLLAIRILCSTVNECYTILGMVHTIWKPLEGRFKDYIAMKKSNGYQSLHTTVICDEGQMLEIQIRTYDMHETAERGVASHWVYKQHDSHSSVNAAELSFVRQVKMLSEKQYNDEDFVARIKNDLLGDFIYVFTPRGDIIELPAGSTAIDFAYSIHSQIGEKIISAKADGSIIPLSCPLKNTQVIEIITHPRAHPTHNQYAHARTAKARQKIRAWLNEHTAQPSEKQDEKTEKELKTHHAGKGPPKTKGAVLQIRVGDSSNFLVKFAQCCKPEKSDNVCGYVSRGRGVIIHEADCKNLQKIPGVQERLIEVNLIRAESSPPAGKKNKKPRSSKEVVP